MAAGENTRPKSSPAKFPAVQPVQPPCYAPAIPLPPYAYIPGHDLPHPVNDPRGHLYDAQKDPAHQLALSFDGLMTPQIDASAHRRDLAATLSADLQWLYALDLFNEGFYWEAHEAWEGFWNALGRSTPDARFVQGLIHLAAACVKVRVRKTAGRQQAHAAGSRSPSSP